MQHYNENAFSAIELLAVTACIGILVAAAIPAWQQNRASQRLIQAAELTVTDLRSTRRLALLFNQRYYLHFDTAAQHHGNDDTWCYVMSTAADCHCFGRNSPPTCQAMPDRRRHWLASTALPGIKLNEARFANHNYAVFNPVRGTASFGHLRFVDDYNHALIINVSLPGRIRICRPASSVAVGHYPLC